MEIKLEYQLYATCSDELTGLLAKEIASIGGTSIKIGYRVVYFCGSNEVAYKVHLHSRLANRICRVLKEIPAQSPTIIFDKAKRIRFHEIFSHNQPVTINIFASNDESDIPNHLIGSKIREAINDCFQHYLKITPNQSSRDAVIGITGYLHNKRLMVSVDTSLESLHKRGYRVEGHPAPLKETLAAALLAACEYDGTTSFFDPMCGSGTIVVEAAQIAINRAPLIDRKKGGFGFEYLLDFDSKLWHTIQDQARAAEHPAKAKIFASDIESRFVEIAKKTVANAQLKTVVHFETKDFFKTEKPDEKGLLIANIPYGVRMTEKDFGKDFLRAIGDHLKNHFKDWRCGILAPASSPLNEIGLKPQKKVSFSNGAVPVKLVVFDIY
jgi:putative N6-adenine-specific DNA methylase